MITFFWFLSLSSILNCIISSAKLFYNQSTNLTCHLYILLNCYYRVARFFLAVVSSFGVNMECFNVRFVNIQDMDAKGPGRQGMHERKETEVQSEVSGPVIYN